MVALGLQREVDHHDGILLHDSYKEQNPDQRHDAEVGAGDQQRKNRADAGRRQRGENRKRMNQALVKDAKDNVDSDQRGENEVGLVLERILESLRRSLEGGVHGGRHSHVALSLLERGYSITERDVRGEIESESNSGILTLVIHGE